MEKALDITARIIRIITIPPIIVTAFLLYLYSFDATIFGGRLNLAVCIAGLGIFPALAYPVWALVPSFRRKKRSFQRKLAFLFSLIGYVAVFVFCHLRAAPERLMLIADAYLASVILLFVINFIFKIKASGHSCSITGPLALLVYLTGLIALVPCLLLEAVSFWASIRTGRHTLKQLLQGAGTALVAFGIALALHFLFGGLGAAV